MKRFNSYLWCVTGLLAALCAQAHASVQITSMTPTLNSPQVLGTPIVWTVTATDSNPGPLTFQFNVSAPGSGGTFALVKDFNAGTLSSGVWTSQPFAWTPTRIEGTYQIQVNIEDFAYGGTNSLTSTFVVSPLVTGSKPVVVPTVNPLVALFSAPSCAAGSSMRVFFQQASKATPPATTNVVACHPPATMTFEIAGMYASTQYFMFAQTLTGSNIVDGPAVAFTTGPLPTTVPFSTYTTNIAPGSQADTADSVLLITFTQFADTYGLPTVASDLSGNILWYYYSNSPDHIQFTTRPLPGGTLLSIEDGVAWNPASIDRQMLREIDLEGNVIKETNTGIIQEQLLAMGATDGGPCNAFTGTPPLGAACLGSFHHDAIQTLPNGQVAVLADIEKIFPAGTQGNTSGLPVDIIGDMIIVLNSNWQVVWYFDTFQHDGGNGQLNINRAAVLGETCVNNQSGCPPVFLLGPGIAPEANDWLHANTIYYQPQDGNIIWSSRHQDWVIKINYNNGSGNGDVVWLMGQDGNFAMNSTAPWPWFSHQHCVGIQNGGTGPMTIFDNGNTRVSPPPLGVGGGYSRGMALTVDETTLQVTPVLTQSLGVYSQAMGSADMLSNGNYFFQAPFVIVKSSTLSHSIELFPNTGAITGTQVFDLYDGQSYRGWRMPSLYVPPLI